MIFHFEVTTILMVETPHPEQGLERAQEIVERVRLNADIDKWDAGAKVSELQQFRKTSVTLEGMP